MSLVFRSKAGKGERVLTVPLLCLFALSGYGIFAPFLPSEEYVPVGLCVTAVLGFLFVLPFFLWWGVGPRFTGTVGKAVAYVFLPVFFSAFAFMAAMFSGPHLVTLAIGASHQEETTVTAKIGWSRRSYCLRRIEIRKYDNRLCLSRDEWDVVHEGDKVVLQGRRSILGFSVENVMPKGGSATRK